MEKKKKKSVALSILLIVAFVIFNGIMVNTAIAEDPGGISGNNGTSSTNVADHSSDDCANSTCAWNKGYGVRICVVDKDGNRVSGVYDFWASKPSYSTGNVYYGKKIKQEATAIDTKTSGDYWKSGNVVEGDEILHYFGLANDASSINSVMEKIKSESKDPAKKKEMIEKVESLLQKLGGVTSLSDAASKGYFIQFELLVSYRPNVNTNKYTTRIGSVTEHSLNSDYAVLIPKQNCLSLFIVNGQKKPEKFTYGQGASATICGEHWVGDGVAHLWTGDLVDTMTCDEVLKYIEKKYSGADYDTKVAELAAGHFEDKDGTTTYVYDSGSDSNAGKGLTNVGKKTYDFLDKNEYSKAEKYGNKAKCENYRQTSCATAVNWINQWGSGKNKSSDQAKYDADIATLAAGEFVYWATDMSKNEAGEYNYWYYKANYDLPNASYTGLLKEVYGDDFAFCASKDELDCNQALAEITSMGISPGTPEYDAKVAEIVAGTFKVEEKDKDGVITKVKKIDRAYPEKYYLKKANYGSGAANCEEPPKSCSEKLNKNIDDCYNGFNYFKDSENEKFWLECGNAFAIDGTEYSSENTGHEAVENAYDGIVGNSTYCKLFCTESFETTFPTKVTGVKAGQTFFWGLNRSDGTYGTTRISKKCSNRKRTDAEGMGGEGYLYGKWDKDYKANETTLVTNYLKKEACAEAKLDKNISNTCSIYCARRVKCGKNSTCCVLWRYRGYASSSWTNTNPTGRDTPWIGGLSGSCGDSKSVSGYATCAGAKSAAKGLLLASLSSKQATAAGAYTSAKNNETPLLNKIRQCTNNIKYIYKTTVNLHFEEPLNKGYVDPNTRKFEYHDLLNMEPDADSGYNKTNVNKSTCKEKIVYSYNCVGSLRNAKCIPKDEKVLDCKQVTWKIDGTWTYKYPEEYFTWFSLKTDSTMMNKKEKSSMSEDEAFFYSIGFGLPTAFTLPNGEYEMSVSVNNVGDNGDITDAPKTDYNKPDGHFGPGLTKNQAGNMGFDYVCTYKVENDIFGYDCEYNGGVLSGQSPEHCDPDEGEDPNGKLIGIDIVYRLVSLLGSGDSTDKAFPGQSGGGRPMGSNWEQVAWEINDILYDDVYNVDRNGQPNLAMYEIFLDTATIQKIRKDNQSVGANVYTTFDNVKCAETGDKNQKYCATDFISDLATGKFGKTLYGTCLTTTSTEARASDVLANGCHGTYNPADVGIDWVRR